MAVNFMHPAFCPAITCDKPSLDGHEVTNLTSNNVQAQKMGFLSESFIKPPINIEVVFPVAVDLDKVMFCPAVGTQRTMSVEIYTHMIQAKRANSNTETSRSVCNNQKVYQKIAYGSCSDNTKQIICFQNRRFHPSKPCSSLQRMNSKHNVTNVSPGTPIDVMAWNMSHHNSRYLWSVGALTIRMTRSVVGKVCAMKWLEIWGQPSPSCEKDTINWVMKTHGEVMSADTRLSGVPHNKRQVVKPGDMLSGGFSMAKLDGVQNMLLNGVTVPQDFIDPITLELMPQPMLLPSGQNIDLQTIEKHNIAEAKWGRPPSDPFTGVNFSASSKAVPNAGLKIRIDKFLLEHGADLPSVARTLGSRQQNMAKSLGDASSLVTKTMNVTNKTDNCLSHTQEIYSKEHDTLTVVSAKRKSEDGYCNSKKRPRALVRDHGKHSVPSSSTTRSASLDDILSNTLQSLPSFLNSNESPSSLNVALHPSDLIDEAVGSKIVCTNCSVSSGLFYRLPCIHILCRSCLVCKTHTEDDSTDDSARRRKCKICKQSYLAQDVVRIHQ